MPAIRRITSTPFRVRLHAVSEKGRRGNNEDFLRAERFSVHGSEVRVFALADGMGGHQGGEIASRTAVETFISYLRENPGLLLLEETAREAIAAGFFLANKKLLQLEEENAEVDGLGTTLTAVVMVGSRYWIGHVGDTRAYRIGAEEIEALTQDHSASAESVRQGLMSESEAAQSPYSHALVRYLGSAEHFAPDIYPARGSFHAAAGSALLLCCDGVFQFVSDLDMYEQVLHSRDLRRAADNLVAMAYGAGSKDNLSVLLVEFGGLRHLRPAAAAEPSPFKKAERRGWLYALAAALLLVALLLAWELKKNLEPQKQPAPATAKAEGSGKEAGPKTAPQALPGTPQPAGAQGAAGEKKTAAKPEKEKKNEAKK